MLLELVLDIQSQTKVESPNQKNPLWPPASNFECDATENPQASAYGHSQHTHEIWNWKSKAKLTYASEIMSSTEGRMDKVNPVYPPPTLLGGGVNKHLQIEQCHN